MLIQNNIFSSNPLHAQLQGGPGGGRAEARHRLLGTQLEAVGGEAVGMRMRIRMRMVGVRMRVLVEISVRGDVSS